MYNQPIGDAALVGCPQCDVLQRIPELAEGASAHCVRCGEELWRRRPDPLVRPLALAIAAAIVYVVANTVPMLSLNAMGNHAATTVLGGAIQLWTDDRPVVAVLVLFTAVVAPALQILFVLASILGAWRAPAPRWVGVLLRHHPTAATWSMIEVMLVGVFVALIKIADYATVVPGTALFALIALVFLQAAIEASFDRRAIWARVTWQADVATARAPAGREVPA